MIPISCIVAVQSPNYIINVIIGFVVEADLSKFIQACLKPIYDNLHDLVQISLIGTKVMVTVVKWLWSKSLATVSGDLWLYWKGCKFNL